MSSIDLKRLEDAFQLDDSDTPRWHRGKVQFKVRLYPDKYPERLQGFQRVSIELCSQNHYVPIGENNVAKLTPDNLVATFSIKVLKASYYYVPVRVHVTVIDNQFDQSQVSFKRKIRPVWPFEHFAEYPSIDSKCEAHVIETLAKRDVLDELIDHIDNDPAQKTPLLWVHGPPGLGKTALMRQFVQEMKVRNKSTCYVDLGSKEPIKHRWQLWHAIVVSLFDDDDDTEAQVRFHEKSTGIVALKRHFVQERDSSPPDPIWFILDGFYTNPAFRQAIQCDQTSGLLDAILEFSRLVSSDDGIPRQFRLIVTDVKSFDARVAGMPGHLQSWITQNIKPVQVPVGLFKESEVADLIRCNFPDDYVGSRIPSAAVLMKSLQATTGMHPQLVNACLHATRGLYTSQVGLNATTGMKDGKARVCAKKLLKKYQEGGLLKKEELKALEEISELLKTDKPKRWFLGKFQEFPQVNTTDASSLYKRLLGLGILYRTGPSRSQLTVAFRKALRK